MKLANPWLPHEECARTSLLYLILPAVLAIVGILVGGWVGMVIGLIGGGVFFTIAIVAAVFLYLDRSYRPQLRLIDTEQCLVHWIYENDLWHRHLARRESKGNAVLWMGAGLFGLSGVMVGMFLVEQDMKIVSSAFGTLLLTALMGGLPGLYLGLLFWSLDRSVLDRMARGPGEAWIGRNAFYLTGQFLPLNDTFHRFTGADLIRVRGDTYLTFSIVSSGPRHRGHTTVEVPVPLGEEDTARRILRVFSEN